LPLTQHSKLITHNSTTDWHCHILPGIDDGPATIEESIEMARILSAAGFTTICCTPHLIKGVYEKSASEIKSLLGQLQEQLTSNSIQMQLLAGAEYYLDEYLHKLLDDPLPLGNSRQILVEIPNQAPIEFVKESCYRIKCSGFIPLIAHPERCTLLEPEPKASGKNGLLGSLFNSKLKSQNSKLADGSLLAYLRDIDCRFQGNFGSFAGIYGSKVRDKARVFLQSDLYDCFGSDAHTPVQLEEMLKRGMQTVKLNHDGAVSATETM
jgi:protein-tyrosine phosphatase